MGNSTPTVDFLVRQIIDHPQFKEALEVRASDSSNSNPQTSPQRAPSGEGTREVGRSQNGRPVQPTASSAQRTAQQTPLRTPVQELRDIFHRNNATAPPQYAPRTTWSSTTSTGRGARSAFGNRVGSRKRDREGKPKQTLFNREVVLLRWPNDTMPRGKAKAELQRLGHVISCFSFDKSWSAHVVYHKLLAAFEKQVPSIANLTCEPKFEVMMGIGSELVEPSLMIDQELNGETISRIFSQKTLWLVPKAELIYSESTTNENSTNSTWLSDGEGSSTDEGQTAINGRCQASCSTTSNHDIRNQASGSGLSSNPSELTSTTSTKGNIQLDELKLIFPSHDVEHLRGILVRSDNIDQAVAEVLDEDCLLITPLEDPSSANMVNEQSNSSPDPLYHYRKQVKKEKQTITFNRMQMSPLRQLMAIFKNPSLDMTKDPDVDFTGELGADLGGPKREFFSLAIHSLTLVDTAYNLQLFGGQPGHLVPLYGVDAISEGCFLMAGKLIAYSVLHSCNGFIGMSPAVVEYISTGDLLKAKTMATTKDLYDLDLRGIIEDKVLGKEDLELTNEERDKIEAKLESHGLSDVIPLTKVNKQKAVNDLIAAEVIITRVLAMDSIFKGLNYLGLGNILRSYPRLVAPVVFPSLDDIKVSPRDMKMKFQQCDARCRTEEEEKAKQWFFDFIKDSAELKDENTNKPLINTLVAFITGSSYLQHDAKMQLTFNEDTTQVLFQADSCFNKIIIPVSHNSYDSFHRALITSLSFGGLGYGKF